MRVLDQTSLSLRPLRHRRTTVADTTASRATIAHLAELVGRHGHRPKRHSIQGVRRAVLMKVETIAK
ncbi:MAG: hypothetical protein ACPG4T_23695 [Nannocystaceae bacterium]